MPIGFDPNDTTKVPLDALDKGKPPEARARFELRFLTAGQVKKLEKLRGQAMTARTQEESDALINEAILMALAGWENVRDHAGVLVPFSPAALDEFSPRLKFRMAAEIPFAMELGDDEKKASSSSAPSATGASAKAAEEDAASTSPPPAHL